MQFPPGLEYDIPLEVYKSMRNENKIEKQKKQIVKKDYSWLLLILLIILCTYSRETHSNNSSSGPCSGLTGGYREECLAERADQMEMYYDQNPWESVQDSW